MSPVRLAIIANEQTPYRLHLHRRIARELPEVELWSLFTHELASSPWQYQEDPLIRPVLFGKGESTRQQSPWAGAWHDWQKGAEIIRWLDEHAIQAIVVFGYNDLARLRIIRWAKARNLRCFLFGDSNIIGDRAVGLKRLLKNLYVPWVLRQVSGVFHCGTLGHAYFRRYHVPPDRLYPFPYEPDYESFARHDPEREVACREQFSLPAHRRYMLFAGRMIPEKRPDLLLEAFQQIAAQRPEWDLVMVGTGPMEAKLRVQLAPRLNARVHWTGFVGDYQKLAVIFGMCDIFVLPSDFEPWGVVLTEAATRLALVASNAVGAAADVLSDGVNGRWFSSGSVESLTQALLDVTETNRFGMMKIASPAVLAAWRTASDPVSSLRRALRGAGLEASDAG